MGTTGQLLNASSLVPFITSMLVLTLVTNVLTTCTSILFVNNLGLLVITFLFSFNCVSHLENPDQPQA